MAKPADQGEESVLLLLLLLLLGTTFQLPSTVFWGVKRQKLCLKRGVKRENCVYNGALISQNVILYTTPQISESILLLFSRRRDLVKSAPVLIQTVPNIF